MRIRKKSSRPAPSKPPLYFIGYSFSAPSSDELAIWYDLEYGGPLRFASHTTQNALLATHGPWQAWLTMVLPEDETAGLRQSVHWAHSNMARIVSAPAAPALILDTVLLAARLARGMTLLTQGTALDLVTQQYSNPSDWNERSLVEFALHDHLHVAQQDADEEGYEWFRTLGLSKFGLDELEMRQRQGLPSAFPIEALSEAADVVLRAGRNPNVGTSMTLPALGRTATVVKHHTVSGLYTPQVFRLLEIA